MNPALKELIRIIDERDTRALEAMCLRLGSDAWIRDLARRALIDVETLDEMLYEIS